MFIVYKMIRSTTIKINVKMFWIHCSLKFCGCYFFWFVTFISLETNSLSTSDKTRYLGFYFDKIQLIKLVLNFHLITINYIICHENVLTWNVSVRIIGKMLNTCCRCGLVVKVPVLGLMFISLLCGHFFLHKILHKPLGLFSHLLPPITDMVLMQDKPLLLSSHMAWW